ncbi:MAG: DUF6385 domain-containing protein [Bacillota bacterium]|nr:DUF6385 domain-containing protein [Bacillota bacterium]
MAAGVSGNRCWIDVAPPAPGSGPVPVPVQPSVFEQSTSVATADALQYFGPHEVGLWPRYVYWYLNTGARTAFIQLELSPDAVNWYVFGSQTLAAGVIDWAFITAPPARYTRLGYRSDAAGQPTSLRLWVQAQMP